MLTQAIQRRIRELCADRNITINKLSTICGITQSTLNNIFFTQQHKTYGVNYKKRYATVLI
ncbi:MAG: helix-turn-helix transcriptional regulator [Ruminococcus sp.]|nr:MAG: helix-turn-helix transcriptional regulator [Ruminococcus sp.]